MEGSCSLVYLGEVLPRHDGPHAWWGHRTEYVLKGLIRPFGRGDICVETCRWLGEVGVVPTVSGVGNNMNSHGEGLEVESPKCVTVFAGASFIFDVYSLGYHLGATWSCFQEAETAEVVLLWVLGRFGPVSTVPLHSFRQRRFKCLHQWYVHVMCGVLLVCGGPQCCFPSSWTDLWCGQAHRYLSDVYWDECCEVRL